MQVLGIAGSLRRQSYSRALLLAAGALLPRAAELAVFEGLAAIPPFNEDMESATPIAVASLRRAVAESAAVIVSTPEYNASVPGTVKNAIDWASRPWPDNCLRNRPTLVIGSAGIFGAAWAQNDMRRILRAAGADVVEAELGPVRADDVFDRRRRIVDAVFRERLRGAVGALVDRVETSSEAVWP